MRISVSAIVVAALLGVALQFVIASVYAGLIVETFGGALNAHVKGVLPITTSYVITSISAATCALYCATRLGPSRVIAAVHLVALVIPLQALVAANFELARPEFAATVGIAYVATISLAGLLADIDVPRITHNGRLAAIAALVLITLYVYGGLIARGGPARINFDLSLVYDVRAEFLESAAPFAGYLIPWQGYVLNPALMLVGIRYRAWLLVAFSLGLQLLLFAMTGFRAFLLSPVMMLALYSIGRQRQLTTLALVGAMAIVAFASALYALLDEPLIPSLLVDRLLIIPAEIHYWYYDFFAVQMQPLLHLSQSLPYGVVAPPHYTGPIAEVIGWNYMGSAASANVGLFGDAFANFGFVGCTIFAGAFALLLKIIDAAGACADVRIASAFVGIPAFQLVNSGLLTTLATHGLAVTIIALWAISERPQLRNHISGTSA